MIRYRVILSKKNVIAIFIQYFENDTILGITIYHQTICSSLVTIKISLSYQLIKISAKVTTLVSWSRCDTYGIDHSEHIVTNVINQPFSLIHGVGGVPVQEIILKT